MVFGLISAISVAIFSFVLFSPAAQDLLDRLASVRLNTYFTLYFVTILPQCYRLALHCGS